MSANAKISVQSVVPCLVFVDRAEEAVSFYVSVFNNSRVLSIVRSTEDGPIPKGKVLHASFELGGQRYIAFDGGSHFKFTEAFSLVATCETQAEIDAAWSKLTEGGGTPGPCGWLTDKFGVSWQIWPAQLGPMLADPQGGNLKAVLDAVLKMGKLDLATLEKAYRTK